MTKSLGSTNISINQLIIHELRDILNILPQISYRNKIFTELLAHEIDHLIIKKGNIAGIYCNINLRAKKAKSKVALNDLCKILLGSSYGLVVREVILLVQGRIACSSPSLDSFSWIFFPSLIVHDNSLHVWDCY